MKIYYCRTSTKEQNEQRQIAKAKEIEADKIYLDKLSGKDTNRPQLKEMLDYVREGDTVYVSEISRLGRNTKDLLEIIDELTKKKVNFVSLKEDIDTTTPCGRFMLTVFSSISQLERDYIRSRQAEGIALAKAKGNVYKGRKKKELGEDFAEAVREWREGQRTATSIMREYDISHQTFYNRAKEVD